MITNGLNDIIDQPQARRTRIDNSLAPIVMRLLPRPPQYGAQHCKKISTARPEEAARHVSTIMVKTTGLPAGDATSLEKDGPSLRGLERGPTWRSSRRWVAIHLPGQQGGIPGSGIATAEPF